MSKTFCVTITECKNNGDKATVGFVVANAALGSDKDTMVFLSTDGVWAAEKNAAAEINEGEPFKPLAELVTNFLAAGGKIAVCAPCCKKRGITQEDLFEGAQIAGGAFLVEWMSNGAPTITY